MTESEAMAVAGALGGVAEQMAKSGWVVRFNRPDGLTVVVSKDGAALYEPGGWAARDEHVTGVWWK